MNSKMTISVVVFLLSGQALALDCKVNLNESERFICNEHTLRDLDEELNKTYSLAMGYVKNKMDLQLSQKSWIKKRDLCRTEKYKGGSDIFQCFQIAYVERLEQLTHMILSSEMTLEPSRVDYRACQVIADLSDDNKLDALKLASRNKNVLVNTEESFEAIPTPEIAQINKFYINAISEGAEALQIPLKKDDSKAKFVSLSTGGTCPSGQIFNLDKLLQSEDRNTGWKPVFDPQEELRWEFMGAEDSIIKFNSQYYVVTENIWGANNLNLVSIINNDGSIQPLCKIKEVKAELVTINSERSDLCEQVATHVIKPIKGERIANQKDSNSYALEVFNIDFNNDGHREKVGIYTEESGHGCGGTEQKLQILLSDLSAPKANSYNKKLEELGQWVRYDTKIQIYKISGKYYAFVNSDGRIGRNFDYFRLIQLGEESVNTVCEFERKRQSKAVKIYNTLD